MKLSDLMDMLYQQIELAPSGGTARERQAWRNGTCELVSVIADVNGWEYLADGTTVEDTIRRLRFCEPGAELIVTNPATTESSLVS